MRQTKYKKLAEEYIKKWGATPNRMELNMIVNSFAQWLDEREEMCFCLQHQTHHSKKDFISTPGVTASAGESCSNSKFDKPQKPKKIEKIEIDIPIQYGKDNDLSPHKWATRGLVINSVYELRDKINELIDKLND